MYESVGGQCATKQIEPGGQTRINSQKDSTGDFGGTAEEFIIFICIYETNAIFESLAKTTRLFKAGN